MNYKSASRILIEAIIVGLSFIVLANVIKFIIPALENKNNQIYLFFVTAFSFHIIFELTGINLWYALEYCNLIIRPGHSM